MREKREKRKEKSEDGPNDVVFLILLGFLSKYEYILHSEKIKP
jgi:hypothetical protein